MMTDGFPELLNTEGEPLGYGRVRDEFAKHATLAPDAITAEQPARCTERLVGARQVDGQPLGHVQHAIEQVPGVESVEVYLVSEKAVILHQPDSFNETAIRKAVASAGYSIPPSQTQSDPSPLASS